MKAVRTINRRRRWPGGCCVRRRRPDCRRRRPTPRYDSRHYGQQAGDYEAIPAPLPPGEREGGVAPVQSASRKPRLLQGLCPLQQRRHAVQRAPGLRGSSAEAPLCQSNHQPGSGPSLGDLVRPRPVEGRNLVLPPGSLTLASARDPIGTDAGSRLRHRDRRHRGLRLAGRRAAARGAGPLAPRRRGPLHASALLPAGRAGRRGRGRLGGGGPDRGRRRPGLLHRPADRDRDRQGAGRGARAAGGRRLHARRARPRDRRALRAAAAAWRARRAEGARSSRRSTPPTASGSGSRPVCPPASSRTRLGLSRGAAGRRIGGGTISQELAGRGSRSRRTPTPSTASPHGTSARSAAPWRGGSRLATRSI